MKKIVAIIIVIVLISPVFSGAKRVEAAAERTIQKAPDAEEKGYVYEPKGRRDPFAPLVEVQARKRIKKQARILGTLESYDIADFKVIAIVAKEGRKHYGLLLTADNKSFTVTEGTVIGLNEGKVKKINSNEVIIEEYIKDFKGELKPRKVVLELRIREGEGR